MSTTETSKTVNKFVKLPDFSHLTKIDNFDKLYEESRPSNLLSPEEIIKTKKITISDCYVFPSIQSVLDWSVEKNLLLIPFNNTDLLTLTIYNYYNKENGVAFARANHVRNAIDNVRNSDGQIPLDSVITFKSTKVLNLKKLNMYPTDIQTLNLNFFPETLNINAGDLEKVYISSKIVPVKIFKNVTTLKVIDTDGGFAFDNPIIGIFKISNIPSNDPLTWIKEKESTIPNVNETGSSITSFLDIFSNFPEVEILKLLTPTESDKIKPNQISEISEKIIDYQLIEGEF